MFLAALSGWGVGASVVDFITVGGIPDDDSLSTAWHNGQLLNATLNALEPGTTFVFTNHHTFTTMGGIEVKDIKDVVIRIDGTISFLDDLDEWPREQRGFVLECLHFRHVHNVTFTSDNHRGVIQGNGNQWWGLPGIGYLQRLEDRPRLLSMDQSTDVVVEYIKFIDSPYWTTSFGSMDGLVIRWSDISARRTSSLGHSLVDKTAFNTDGFDFTGRNIHVHDVTVYSQDDCIAIKDGTENVLVERVNASGLGLTIGSIGGSVVRNITVRDCYLSDSSKGIYMKFRTSGNSIGSVSDVLFENIVIDNNEDWAIWIGPAQQSDSVELCAPHPCSLCWPLIPGAECNGGLGKTYNNITLRNIEIRNPQSSPGVILADPTWPMYNVTFDNVRVTRCADISAHTFANTFPNLPTSIYDVYVVYFALMWVAVALVLVVAPCICCFCVGCCTRVWWKIHPRTRWCVLATVGVVLAGVLVLGGWLAHVNAGVSALDTYYECKGVVGGVATGNTWPVPHCFEDRTTSGQPVEDCGLDWPAIFGIVLASLAFVFGALVLVLKLKCPARYAAYKGRCADACCCSAGAGCCGNSRKDSVDMDFVHGGVDFNSRKSSRISLLEHTDLPIGGTVTIN